MKVKLIGLLLINSVILLACSDEMKEPVSSEVKYIQRDVDPIQYSRGARLYQLNCAACHGKNGEGAKNWQQPDENGKNPAPPLNGTGHTWHHSMKALKLVINNGTGKIGGNMPAWKGVLTDREISLILTWVTAQWPDELYTAWYNRFQKK